MKPFKSLYTIRRLLPGLFLSLGISSATIAQENYTPNILPPAPEAAALGKYVETPVNLYTGVPQIDVPLTEVQEGSITVPVSLSYHAGGNRVEDIATYAGLGWSLNAGGVITRAVRGLPDDLPNMGFLSFIQEPYGTFNYLVSGDAERHIPLKLLSSRCRDAEPDQYYFNFNGYKGKFTFDWNGQLVVDSDKKITVSPEFDSDGSILSWEVILDNGMSCTFAAVDYTHILGYNIGCDIIQDYASSWYLTALEDVNEQNTVSFEYENYPLHFPHEQSESISHLFPTSHGSCSGSASGRYTLTVTTMSHTGKRISRIHTDSGSEVLFSAINDRMDIEVEGAQTALQSLDRVTVKNSQGETIRQYNLAYDYSTGRLTLRSVTELNGQEAKPPYTFNYNGTILPDRTSKSRDHWGYYNNNSWNTLLPPVWIANGSGNPTYYQGADRSPAPERMKAGVLEKMTYPTGGFVEFEYEAHEYGYINGMELQEFEIIPQIVEVQSVANCEVACTNVWDVETLHIASSQTPVEVTASVRLISTSPFGNADLPYVRLEDENGNTIRLFDDRATNQTNTYHLQLAPGTYVVRSFARWDYDPSPVADFAEASFSWENESTVYRKSKTAGGLRIKRLKEYAYENDSKVNIRRYEYLMPDERASGVLNGEPFYNYVSTSYQPVTGLTETPCQYFNRAAQNIASFGSIQGTHTGYREVTVYYGENGENGKSLQRFSFTGDHISVEPPFAPATSYDYKRGLPTERIDYKKEGTDYVAVKKNTFNYEYKEEIVQALKVGFQGGITGTEYLDKFNLGPYQSIIGHHKPVREEETLYSMASGQQPYTAISQYAYDADYQNMLRLERNKSDGEQQIVEYYYADDYTAISDPNHFIAQMKNRNMRGIPIETVTKKGNGSSEEVVASEFRSFRLDNSLIYPASISLLETDRSLNNFDYSFDNTNATTDNRYGDEVIQYEQYDSEGNISQYTDRTGITTAAQWGYGQKLPVANAVNAKADQIYFQSFEEDAQATENGTNARSGLRYWNSGTYTINFAPPLDGNSYLMSYWYYDGSEWQLVQDVPFLPSISASGSRLDDIRVYPEGAQMTTYTYQPGVGVTSQSDVNNSTTFYEYDGLGRVIVVRDHEGNILKTYEYRYAD